MAGILFVGSTSTGHGGFPPTTAISGSPTVSANGNPISRLGDAWATHCNDSCHSGVTTPPAPRTVFADGLPVGMVGDPLSCGDTSATGSVNVFIGM